MPDAFPARLRLARERIGGTREQIAAMVGVTTSTMYRWETGASSPQPTVVDRLCRVLGIRREWLETGEQPMEAPDGATPEQPTGQYAYSEVADGIQSAWKLVEALDMADISANDFERLVFAIIEVVRREHLTSALTLTAAQKCRILGQVANEQ